MTPFHAFAFAAIALATPLLCANSSLVITEKLNAYVGCFGMTVAGTIEDGMAQMSEKFRQMGEQVYVDAATAVKESNRVL